MIKILIQFINFDLYANGNYNTLKYIIYFT